MSENIDQVADEANTPVCIPFHRCFQATEIGALTSGLRPESMDDKWFGDVCVVLGRSWTGKHSYVLPIVFQEKTWTVQEIQVIGPTPFVRDENEHIRLVERILNRWLGREIA